MGAGQSTESLDADSTRTSIESQSAGDASSLRSIEVEVPAPADEDSNKAVLVGTLPFPPASTLPAPNPLRTIMSGEALPAESTRRTPNSTEPSPSLKSVAAAPPANAAASKLGAALKGGKLRRDLMAVMGRAAADPKIEVSVEHAEALMPHDEQGRMLPLGCPLGCFQVFGSGVFVYMAWMQHMRGVFGMAFLFSLPNLVYNWLGNEIEKASWLNVHTIGTDTSINATSESPAAQPARRPTRRRPTPARRAAAEAAPHTLAGTAWSRCSCCCSSRAASSKASRSCGARRR